MVLFLPEALFMEILAVIPTGGLVDLQLLFVPKKK